MGRPLLHGEPLEPTLEGQGEEWDADIGTQDGWDPGWCPGVQQVGLAAHLGAWAALDGSEARM